MKSCEKNLEFSGVIGRAVIVQPETPWNFTFWRGAQYVGCMDLGSGVWFTPEWLETNSPEDLHCYEPIMDKQCKYSYAQIIETGDVRTRVNWHYACCNNKYEIFHGNTEADEYYTIYPDGIAVRTLVAWPGDKNAFGGNSEFWQVLEYILINSTGSRFDEVIDCKKSFEFMNEKGEKLTFEWPLPTPPDNRIPLCKLHPELKEWKIYIGRVNLKNQPSPFVAFLKDQRFFPYKPCVYCGGNHPFFGIFQSKAVWKHWPANPMENFVLAVEAEENEWGQMPTHTSFLDCNYTSIFADVPPKGCTWNFLIGAQEKPDDQRLLEVIKSWANPAKIETGYESRRLSWGLSYGPILYEGYVYAERAYYFRLAGTDKLKFKFIAIEKIINPVFRVENWGGELPKVFLDHRQLNENSFKWQFDGRFLTVWIKGEFTKPVEVKIE